MTHSVCPELIPVNKVYNVARSRNTYVKSVQGLDWQSSLYCCENLICGSFLADTARALYDRTMRTSPVTLSLTLDRTKAQRNEFLAEKKRPFEELIFFVELYRYADKKKILIDHPFFTARAIPGR